MRKRITMCWVLTQKIPSHDLEAIYYQLARRYHPDRFRKSDASLVARIESTFARITQAYETLRDDRLRADLQLESCSAKKGRTVGRDSAKSQRDVSARGG